jgi:hypothetical protein
VEPEPNPDQVQQGSPTQPGGHSHFSTACDLLPLTSCRDFSADSVNIEGGSFVVFSVAYSSFGLMSVSDPGIFPRD